MENNKDDDYKKFETVEPEKDKHEVDSSVRNAKKHYKGEFEFKDGLLIHTKGSKDSKDFK